GIAKALNSSAETRTGVLKGKVAYMAPEQARGERVDRRADLFSVGVLLWEAAAGKRLWKGVPDITILQRLLSGDIPPPSSVRPVPPRLEHVVMRALSSNRDHRQASAADLQAEIDFVIDELGVRATPRDVGRVVAQHFDAERSKIKSLVEEQLRRPDGRLPVLEAPPTMSASTLERVPMSGSDGSVSSVVSFQSPGAPANTSSYTAASTLSSRAGAPIAAPRRGLVAGLALAGGAALAVVFWVMTRGQAAPAAATTTAAPAAPPSATASSAAAAPTGDVELRVSATPSDAKIFVDDVLVKGNPYRGKLPRGDVTHTVRAEAEGYTTHTRTVTSMKDLDLELALQKDEKPSAEKKDKGRPAPAAASPAPAKDDEMRPAPKPRRTLDTSNPYNK
ncbi:MAG TPA: protein kinase, partial [Byssovorax sp.]